MLLWKYRCKAFPNDIVVLNGLVYLSCCENDLYVLDEKTGEELWRFPTNGWIIRVIEYNGNIYFGSWGCNIYSIKPDGSLRWKFHTSLSYQAPLEPEEGSKARVFSVVWTPETVEKKEKKYEESVSGDYNADFASGYTSVMKTNYLGFETSEDPFKKKKHHYA